MVQLMVRLQHRPRLPSCKLRAQLNEVGLS